MVNDPRMRGTGRPSHTHFGRADLVDRDGLRRLVRSISRFLDPTEYVKWSTETGGVAIPSPDPWSVRTG